MKKKNGKGEACTFKPESVNTQTKRFMVIWRTFGLPILPIPTMYRYCASVDRVRGWDRDRANGCPCSSTSLPWKVVDYFTHFPAKYKAHQLAACSTPLRHSGIVDMKVATTIATFCYIRPCLLRSIGLGLGFQFEPIRECRLVFSSDKFGFSI